MVDTDERFRIEARFDSMKLTLQIAGGIFLAGVVSWIFWLSIFAAAAPQIAQSLPHFIPSSTGPVIHLPPAPAIPRQSTCENFVQMTNGERHCLENQHPHWSIESAALPPTPIRSAAR
jgi:hypothetical protein